MQVEFWLFCGRLVNREMVRRFIWGLAASANPPTKVAEPLANRSSGLCLDARVLWARRN